MNANRSLLFFAIQLTLSVPGNGQTIFDDGKSHLVDRELRHESNPTGIAAVVSSGSTIEAVEGASIFGIVLNDGHLITRGGQIHPTDSNDFVPAIDSTGASSIHIFSGQMRSIFLDGTSSMIMEGGKITSGLRGVILRGSSHGTITGGMIAACEDEIGPAIDVRVRSELTLDGGTISCETGSGVLALGNFTMTGGELDVRNGDGGGPHGVVTASRGQASIHGGTITLGLAEPFTMSHHLVAKNASSIYLFGSEFNFPLGPIDDLDGEISGLLSDGTQVSWRFRRDHTASIVLVPEPTSMISIYLGLVALFARRHT